MLTVKAKIPAQAGYEPILPLALPDLREVRSFAGHLQKMITPFFEKMYNERRVFAPFHRTPGCSTPSGFSTHAGNRGMI